MAECILASSSLLLASNINPLPLLLAVTGWCLVIGFTGKGKCGKGGKGKGKIYHTLGKGKGKGSLPTKWQTWQRQRWQRLGGSKSEGAQADEVGRGCGAGAAG